VIHKKLVPEGKTVNSELYVQMLERLLKGISRVRPQFCEKSCWSLLQNNVVAHSTMTVKSSPVNHSMVQITHPSSSLDLMPANFFLFPEVKTALKERRLQDVKGI
jgi:hypothetical protein